MPTSPVEPTSPLVPYVVPYVVAPFESAPPETTLVPVVPKVTPPVVIGVLSGVVVVVPPMTVAGLAAIPLIKLVVPPVV